MTIRLSLDAPSHPLSLTSQNEDARLHSKPSVLFLGMNESSQVEAQALRQAGVSVVQIANSKTPDVVEAFTSQTTANSYALTSLRGVGDFVATLGLGPQQSAHIAQAIFEAGPNAKDEFAQLARVWAAAEKGQSIPSRLVLSGHHVGSGVWGDNNGRMTWDALKTLAQAMPQAARQIHDLHVAACYSGWPQHFQRYREIFPEVKTLWAYEGSAPGAASGATTHLIRWEKATRPGASSLTPSVASGTRKGEFVAVWSRSKGYLPSQQAQTFSKNLARWQQQQTLLQSYFTGEREVDNPQQGPLRQHYHLVQELLGAPNLPYGDLTRLLSDRDVSLRLMFFRSKVAPAFQRTYQKEIEDGFAALHLPIPNFAHLSRAESLQRIEQFQVAFRQMHPEPQAARILEPLLREGLKELKPHYIPETWI